MTDNKKFELTDEEMKQISGGSGRWHIRCSNPDCPNHWAHITGSGAKCLKCGSDMMWDEEGFD